MTWLACLVMGAQPAAALAETPRAEPVRLLFAGSSSVYWNDMPREVAGVVDGRLPEFPGRPVRARIVGRSGSDIRVYDEPGFSRYEYGVPPGGSFRGLLREGQQEVVVLMVTARFIMGDGEGNPDGRAHREAIHSYTRAIRDAGAEPVYYEVGWGEGPREAEGRRRLFALAQENRIRRFVPCATAWAKVREQRPDLALQHPRDSTHPGDAGHFLNLACFFAALTGTSPEGTLPRTFPVWPHWTAAEKKEQAEAIAQNIERFQPDDYQSQMPKWMWANMSARQVATLDEETARFLERTAWTVWQSFDSVLKQARTP